MTGETVNQRCLCGGRLAWNLSYVPPFQYCVRCFDEWSGLSYLRQLAKDEARAAAISAQKEERKE